MIESGQELNYCFMTILNMLRFCESHIKLLNTSMSEILEYNDSLRKCVFKESLNLHRNLKHMQSGNTCA